MSDQTATAIKPHPFEPRHDGKACRTMVAVVDYRPVECGGQPGDEMHTGARPAPPELEHRYPLCPLCGEECDHDGDSFCCNPCGAYWPSDTGRGEWNEPETKVCTSTCKPFDRPNLSAEHESIRHNVAHCILPADHDGDHRSDELTRWSA